MKPEEALQVLDHLAGMAAVSRAAHVQGQQAVEVIGALVQRFKAHEKPEPAAERGDGPAS